MPRSHPYPLEIHRFLPSLPFLIIPTNIILVRLQHFELFLLAQRCLAIVLEEHEPRALQIKAVLQPDRGDASPLQHPISFCRRQQALLRRGGKTKKEEKEKSPRTRVHTLAHLFSALTHNL